MTLAHIITTRTRLNALKRFKLNMSATRPTPVWPANLGGLSYEHA